MSIVFEMLSKFRTDRGLCNLKYNDIVFLRKAYEELFELINVENPDKKADIRAKYDVETMQRPVEVNEKIDALCDVIVFAIEAIEQLGYNAEKCLVETAREINSREGEIIDGKFQKYKTSEAMAKWYKANYNVCKGTQWD